MIAKSLGEKSGKDDKEADKIAFIRLAITLQILVTNFFIIGGVIVNIASIAKHWNDETNVEVYIDGVKPKMYQTPISENANRTFEFE